MIAISHNWIAQDSEARNLILNYPQPAGVLRDVEKAHQALLALEVPAQSLATAQLIAAQQDLDNQHDCAVRAIDACLTAAVMLSKNADFRAQLDGVRRMLLPTGLSIVTSSYLDEIGNAKAAKTRLTAESIAILKRVPTPEGDLFDAVSEWFGIAAQMEELEKKRQAEAQAMANGATRADCVTARNRWIRAASALESMVELAELPDDVSRKILGELKDAESRTVHRSTRKASSSKPAGTPTPTPTD
jgi:hypothetical protein